MLKQCCFLYWNCPKFNFRWTRSREQKLIRFSSGDNFREGEAKKLACSHNSYTIVLRTIERSQPLASRGQGKVFPGFRFLFQALLAFFLPFLSRHLVTVLGHSHHFRGKIGLPSRQAILLEVLSNWISKWSTAINCLFLYKLWQTWINWEDWSPSFPVLNGSTFIITREEEKPKEQASEWVRKRTRTVRTLVYSTVKEGERVRNRDVPRGWGWKFESVLKVTLVWVG